MDSSGRLDSSLPCFTMYSKIFGVPGKLSLEVTNMPRTAKALGSSLTRTCFFFQMENILFQKKISANYLSAYLYPA